MNYKTTSRNTQTLNSFLGFGWSTGTKSLKKDLVQNNTSNKINKKNIH